LTEPVSIVLIGLGGYGSVYLAALLDQRADERIRVAGGIDPEPDRCERLAELRRQNVPIFRSPEAFFDTGRADLAVISSPLQHHAAQTCLALAHGSHVLCEKPAAPTVQELDRMIRARDEARRFVAIGYQWSFSDTIRQLKAAIRAGRFGEPRRAKTLCLWPRTERYYHRNDWAGRRQDEHGHWVLDSPVNNAMAHFLHNLLYLLGDTGNTSARPVDVTAETCRANPIDNFDTAAIRVHTDAGVEILFCGSHAIREDFGPIFSLEFTRGHIEYAGGQAAITARFDDGSVEHYAPPDSEPQTRKLWTCVQAVRDGTTIPCGLEAARSLTLCTNGAQDSAPDPAAFPRDLVRVTGEPPDRLTWVHGLANTLQHCYAENALPRELDVAWANSGRPIDLRDYRYFPGGRPRQSAEGPSSHEEEST